MEKITKTNRQWKGIETKALKQFLPQLGIDAMAIGLGRSPGAVVEKAKELKIMRAINITEADIATLLDYAKDVMKNRKGSVVVYYSTERDRLIAKPTQWQLAKSVRAQLAERPDLVAGKYPRGTPSEVMLPDIRALAARLNGKPSEINSRNRKNRKTRKTNLASKENKSMGMNYPLTVPLGERKTCIHFFGALNHVA